MIELDAGSLLAATTSLARMHQILAGLSESQHEELIPDSVKIITSPMLKFIAEANKIGAKLSSLAADRFVIKINSPESHVTVGQSVIIINEIESRFADHLTGMNFLFIPEADAGFANNADMLVGIDSYSSSFPKAAFEIEEASKCILFDRCTASVFHSMRMLEIGIRALSKRLGMDDPVKTSDKNWGTILKAISTKIDETWPKNTRLEGSDGARFEALHATLDAVKNPWRNATMHVETIYLPHEATHILRCTTFFMILLSSLCDESGKPTS